MTSPESTFFLATNGNNPVWDDFINTNFFDTSATYPLLDALADTAINTALLNSPFYRNDGSSATSQLFLPAALPTMSPNTFAQPIHNPGWDVLHPVQPEIESCWSVDHPHSPFEQRETVSASSSASEASTPRSYQSALELPEQNLRSPPRRVSSSRSSTSVIKRPQKQRPRGRRRKSCKSPCSDSEEAGLKAKAAHSAIERRYRDKLNDKMMQLHRVLVASESSYTLTTLATSPGLSSTSTERVRKAEIMSSAIAYICQAEVEMRHMTNEIEQLQRRLHQLETLVPCEDHTMRRLVEAC